jgi:phage shock protein A
MEEKIEGREAEGSAMAEVEQALGKGAKADDLESRFRDLERQVGGKGDEGGGGGGTEIDDELAAMKKRIRV